MTTVHSEGVIEQFEKHPQWTEVSQCLQALHAKGFKAYIAGGSVRDALLGRQANDFDIATSAIPDQIEEIFEKTIAVGKQFGVIIVPFDGFQVEIATFRKDLEYKDGRRPDAVEFSSPEEDASRRDFTVNGLFFDTSTNKVIDFVGGQDDLRGKVLRVIGEPSARFSEDYLRLLRAIRFRAQLDFAWDPATKHEVVGLNHKITNVSSERIRDELVKILKLPNAMLAMTDLLDMGYIHEIFYSFISTIQGQKNWQLDTGQFANRLQNCFAGDHRNFKRTEQLISLVFGALSYSFQFTSKEERKKFLDLVGKTLQELKFSNDEIRFVKTFSRLVALIRSQEAFQEFDEFIFDLTNENHLRILKFLFSTPVFEESEIMSLRDKIIEVFSADFIVPEALITGDDLLSLGMKQGKDFGQALKKIYIEQLNHPEKTRDDLLKSLKSR